MMPTALAAVAAWTFRSAPLSREPATGREVSPGVHEMRVPSRGSCGWWETSSPVVSGGGARFRATAEIAVDDENDFVHNDLMMFVRWDNWFSESVKLVKRGGVELLLFPLAGCAMDHIETVFPSRAIDSGIPMLVAMRQGHLPNGIIDRDGKWIAQTFEDCGYAVADIDLRDRKRTFWLSVGPGGGDPYELYYDESRPEVYEKFDWRQPRR